MAFTDPIVAGDELIRAAINSSNYVQGADGWRIARDGSAEFNSLNVRDNLNVNSITLDGRDLNTLIADLPKGCVAFVQGFPVVATNTSARFMVIEFDIQAGRFYEVAVTNITADQGNANLIEYSMRWEFGANPPIPTVASDMVYNSLRNSMNSHPVMRFTFWSGANARLKIAAFITSLDGAVVRTWAPGAGGCYMSAYDHGKAPYNHPGVGVVGGGGGAKQLKEWTHSTSVAARYKGNGQLYTPGGLPSDSMSQGDFSDGNGNYRSWAIFDGAGLADIADVVGVPFADILTCELYFNYDVWHLGQGIATLGYHNQGAIGIAEPGGGVAAKILEPYTSTGGKWIDLKAAGTGAGTFMEAMQSGYFKGLMIGNFGGTNKIYTGFAQHTSGIRPALHLKYYK